jgi:peptidoglycan/xylan/chitin deacetylase (PgdA/CDA1 family)
VKFFGHLKKIRFLFPLLALGTFIIGVIDLISLYSAVEKNVHPVDIFHKGDNSIESSDNVHPIGKTCVFCTTTIPGYNLANIIDTENFDHDYDYPPVQQFQGTVRVPILTYHHISKLPKNMSDRSYFVSPVVFDEQMAYLEAKHYRTLTPEELYNLLLEGKNPKQKSVMITFDDGNKDNYENAFPILKKYGFVGVFYIPSSKSGISTAQLVEMVRAGMIIDSHSATHMALQTVTDDYLLQKEITSSKSIIEHMTGRTIFSFSYPGCGYSGLVISKVRMSNYLIAVTCGKSIDHTYKHRFELSRMHVYNDLENFKKRLSGIFEIPVNYPD